MTEQEKQNLIQDFGMTQDFIDLLESLQANTYDLYRGEEITFPNLFGHGDYAGSLVGKANRLAIEEGKYRFPLDRYGVESTSESYGYTKLAFSPKLWRRWYTLLKDTLEGLADYPVVDDEMVSKVEDEDKLENWNSWMFSEFKEAIPTIFGEWYETDYLDSDAGFWFADRILNDNGQWHEDGTSMYMNVDKELRRFAVQPGVMWEEPEKDSWRVDAPLWGLAVNLESYYEEHGLPYRWDTTQENRNPFNIPLPGFVFHTIITNDGRTIGA